MISNQKKHTGNLKAPEMGASYKNRIMSHQKLLNCKITFDYGFIVIKVKYLYTYFNSFIIP